MAQFDLKHYLLWGYETEIEDQDYLDLRNSLTAFQKSNNQKSEKELTEAIVKDYPQLKVLHDAYLRNRLNKITSAVGTIKTIVVVYFICSLLAALLFFV
ncbi:hypothetical protein [Sunxiuqinia rutila]|uniref:hypothetical protein n=1 Tax=Sunxiuqinia rutila TaxID=1397841 RepID=UPI003D365885